MEKGGVGRSHTGQRKQLHIQYMHGRVVFSLSSISSLFVYAHGSVHVLQSHLLFGRYLLYLCLLGSLYPAKPYVNCISEMDPGTGGELEAPLQRNRGLNDQLVQLQKSLASERESAAERETYISELKVRLGRQNMDISELKDSLVRQNVERANSGIVITDLRDKLFKLELQRPTFNFTQEEQGGLRAAHTPPDLSSMTAAAAGPSTESYQGYQAPGGTALPPHQHRNLDDKTLWRIAKYMTHFDPKPEGALDTQSYLEEIDYNLRGYEPVDVGNKISLISFTSNHEVNCFLRRLPLDTLQSWHCFRLAFVEEFADHQALGGLLTAMAVRQFKTEPVDSFYCRLRRAYFGGTNTVNQDEDHTFKTLFLNNLHPAIREWFPIGLDVKTTQAITLRSLAREAFARECSKTRDREASGMDLEKAPLHDTLVRRSLPQAPSRDESQNSHGLQNGPPSNKQCPLSDSESQVSESGSESSSESQGSESGSESQGSESGSESQGSESGSESQGSESGSESQGSEDSWESCEESEPE